MEDDLSVCDVFNLDFCQDRPLEQTMTGWGNDQQSIRMKLPLSSEDKGCLDASERRLLSKRRDNRHTAYLIAIVILAVLLCLVLIG